MCNVEADLIPGPKERPIYESTPNLWKEAVEFIEDVVCVESCRMSLKFSCEGLTAAPSSEMALQDLFFFSLEEQ